MRHQPAHCVEVRQGPLPGVHAVLTDSERGFDKHCHDSFGFGLMDAGAHRSCSGRGQVVAQTGDIVTTNPGEMHDGHPVGHHGRRWRIVHLTPAAMAALVGRADHELNQPVFEDARLRTAIGRMFDHWDALRSDGAPALAGQWEEALGLACGELVARHSEQALADRSERLHAPGIERVRDCLQSQLAAPPDLGALAALAGLSRFQLVRQFARAQGLPPFAWLQQQRLARARELIRHGASLSDTAQNCGFADQSHLHRHFVRCFGFTPGAWQRACRPSLQ
ncbi:AraC family transcriptional regulator [Hydrogenophaga sp.]|uniref:helix-turn-helix transcriptional regulator n=1 Tax=Hydrogenophaga sp. TaxID=1904254 RepID=UPI0025C2EC0E|nr:AraC family transcriptional regulator [Hydrogenophaga sp.]